MNQCWRVQSASPQSDAGAIVLEFQNGHSVFYQRFSSLTVVGTKGRQGGGEAWRGGMKEKGQGSSTDCLSIAADGVPKPTTGANIIASNIIHYRCQRRPPSPLFLLLHFLPSLCVWPTVCPHVASWWHCNRYFSLSRSLPQVVHRIFFLPSLLPCCSLLKKKSMKLQGDIPCSLPPPPSSLPLYGPQQPLPALSHMKVKLRTKFCAVK